MDELTRDYASLTVAQTAGLIEALMLLAVYDGRLALLGEM